MRTWTGRFVFLVATAALLSLKSCPERIEEAAFHPRVLPRGAWRPSQEVDKQRLRPMARPFRITVHHSATAVRQDSWAATCAAIRAIQTYHVVKKGWADIAYHFVIDRAGRIWEGRPLAYQGAHAGSTHLNRGNVGIVVLGNFERRKPTPGEEAGLSWLVDQLSRRYSISADQIFCHSDLKATRCPGQHLKPLVRRLAAAIDSRHREARAASEFLEKPR